MRRIPADVPKRSRRTEELMPDLVLPRPTVAELIRAPGPAGEDLRNAVAIRRQHLAELLVVGERV